MNNSVNQIVLECLGKILNKCEEITLEILGDENFIDVSLLRSILTLFKHIKVFRVIHSSVQDIKFPVYRQEELRL